MEPSYAPSINPVPLPLWGVNLRALMTRTEWRRERRTLLEGRGQRCETCGEEEELSRRIYAHEEWEYVTGGVPAVARLMGIKLSCWHCHACEHFGAVKGMVATGRLSQRAIEDTIAHFCRLNGVDEAAFHAHHREAFLKWAELNSLTWRIDWGPYTGWVQDTFEGDLGDIAWWKPQIPPDPPPQPWKPKPSKSRTVSETPEEREARLARQREYQRRYRERLKREEERAARRRERQRQYRAAMKAHAAKGRAIS